MWESGTHSLNSVIGNFTTLPYAVVETKKKKKEKKRLSVAALCVDSLEAAAEDDMTMKLNSV